MLKETKSKFSGTRVYAPDEYLKMKKKPNYFSPHPWHDLEAAVKSLYVLMHSDIFYSQFPLNSHLKNNARILEFWAGMKQSFKYKNTYLNYL